MVMSDTVESNVRAALQDGAYVRLGIRLESQVADNHLRGVDPLAQQELYLLGTEPVSCVRDDRGARPGVRPRRRAKNVRLAFGHASLAGSDLDRACPVSGAPHALGQLAHEQVRQRVGVQGPYHRVQGGKLLRE